VKLPAHGAGPFDPALRGTHGPEYVEWASRARSGEPDASKGNFVCTVPLDPAYKAGLAGHVPVNRSSRAGFDFFS